MDHLTLLGQSKKLMRPFEKSLAKDNIFSGTL